MRRASQLAPSTRFSPACRRQERSSTRRRSDAVDRPASIRRCGSATSSFRRPRAATTLPDLLRLERALAAGPLEIDLSLLRELPARLRAGRFSRHGRAGRHGRLLDFEPGNTEADAFAVAFDVGTTTLVGALLDLGTGSERAVDARLNPQTRFGDDVLSRILHARQEPDGLRQLHEAIVAAVDEMIGELCRQAGIPRERIYELAFAGNTTMQQLLCGVDPEPAGRGAVRAGRRPRAWRAWPRSWGCTSIPAAAAT